MCEATEVLTCYGGPVHRRDVEIASDATGMRVLANGARYVRVSMTVTNKGGIWYTRDVLLYEGRKLEGRQQEEMEAELISEAINVGRKHVKPLTREK